MYRTTLLKDEHVGPLADAACGVLEKVGVLCQNAQLLRALSEAGCNVDAAAERVWFPRKRVEAFIDGLRAESAGDPLVQTEFGRPGMPGLGCQIAQHYYDHDSRQRRAGNREDLIVLIKLASALHPDVAAGHALVQTEVPPRLEALESAMLLAEYAHRPGKVFAWYVDQIDYLIEMGEILGEEDWFSWGATCFAHPLRFDKDVADKFVRRVREGNPTGLTAMPVAGFTTPATVEGFIAVVSAEHVATWFAARAVNPNVPLAGSMWAGTIDMATGSVSYSAFDAMYYAFAAVEFLRRWTGRDVIVGGGEYCDAREPGLYAAMEKAYKAMTIAAFTGRHPAIGGGMLESGKVMAPVQLMIERDLTEGVRHFGRNVNPTLENIAQATIEQVDLGLTVNHMVSQHTLEHFRSSLWLPKLIDRSGWKGSAGDAEMLDKAQGRIARLLAEYRKPEGREEQLVKMRQVVERARQTL